MIIGNEISSSSSEDPEMEQINVEAPAEEQKSNQTMQSASSGKRGRKKLPALWSRIIEVDAE
jgi:hypothetical protein